MCDYYYYVYYIMNERIFISFMHCERSTFMNNETRKNKSMHGPLNFSLLRLNAHFNQPHALKDCSLLLILALEGTVPSTQ